MNHWLSLTPRSDLVARLVVELEGELYQPRIAGMRYLIVVTAGRGVIGRGK
jgi:hypothetical protein